MLIPVRCFSCGKVLGHFWEDFDKRRQKGEDTKKILDDFGIDRYCCRALMLGHVDLLEKVAKFTPPNQQ